MSATVRRAPAGIETLPPAAISLYVAAAASPAASENPLPCFRVPSRARACVSRARAREIREETGEGKGTRGAVLCRDWGGERRAVWWAFFFLRLQCGGVGV